MVASLSCRRKIVGNFKTPKKQSTSAGISITIPVQSAVTFRGCSLWIAGLLLLAFNRIVPRLGVTSHGLVCAWNIHSSSICAIPPPSIGSCHGMGSGSIPIYLSCIFWTASSHIARGKICNKLVLGAQSQRGPVVLTRWSISHFCAPYWWNWRSGAHLLRSLPWRARGRGSVLRIPSCFHGFNAWSCSE